MTYPDPIYMEHVAPNCHNQVPILSAIGRGPVGPQGPRGVPGPLSRKDFDTVTDMIADESLVEGDICHTLGFHAVDDGGAAWYKITDDAEPNGMDVIELANGNYAELKITTPYVTPEMFGAYGDGVHDDSLYIHYAIKNYSKVIFINKIYLMIQPIFIDDDIYVNIDSNVKFYNGSGFNQQSQIVTENGLFVSNEYNSNVVTPRISGKISNIQISSKTGLDIAFLYSDLFHCDITNCSFYNFKSIFKCRIQGITHINKNDFLHCHDYFIEEPYNGSFSLSDSYICENYINGISNKDNYAFFVTSLTNTKIENNYFDFWNYIYSSSSSYVYSIVSTNNTYDCVLGISDKDIRCASFDNDFFMNNANNSLENIGSTPSSSRNASFFNLGSSGNQKIIVSNAHCKNVNKLCRIQNAWISANDAKQIVFKKVITDAYTGNPKDLYDITATNNENGMIGYYLDDFDLTLVSSTPAETTGYLNGMKIFNTTNNKIYMCFEKIWIEL